MLELTMVSLTMWTIDTYVNPMLIDMVEKYLLGQGSKAMSGCLHIDNGNYVLLAPVLDQL